MNKAVPWNINGVGFDAREAAREAARRQGKSLGEWLDAAIAEHAAVLGVREDDVGAQDRIDAVTAKLERLSVRPKDGPRGRRDRDDFAQHTVPADAARDHDDDDLDDGPLVPRYRRPAGERYPERPVPRPIEEPAGRYREERRPSRSKMAIDDTEGLLEEAIEAMDRRAQRAERKTDKALASFAKIIETTENKHDDEREMFTALSRKLTDMETRIASRVTDDNYRPIKGALARLEARLDALGRRVTSDLQASFGPIDQAAAEPHKTVQTERADPRREPLDQAGRREPLDHTGVAEKPIERLESKLNIILEALRPAASVPARSVSIGRDVRPADGLPPDAADQRLDEAIAEIVGHQRALDRSASRRSPAGRGSGTGVSLDDQRVGYRPNVVNRLGRALQGASAEAALLRPVAAEPHPAFDRLQNDVAGLATKFDELRRDLALSRTLAPRAEADGREAAKSEPAKPESVKPESVKPLPAQDAAPSRSALEAARMAAALDDMRGNLIQRLAGQRLEDDKAEPAATRPDVEKLRADVAAMARMLGQLAPRDNVMALEDAIRSLVARIEGSQDKAASEAMVRTVQQILGDIRLWLANTDPRATIGVLEREIRTIGDKLDTLGAKDGAAALAPIERRMDEMRDLMSAAAAAKSVPLERIEKQVATLAAKIDRLPSLSADDDRTFQAAAEKIRSMLPDSRDPGLFDKIDRRLDSLGSKVDRAVTEASGARQVAEQSKHHFDTMERSLASRIDSDRRQPMAPPVDVSGLETLVRDLSERIDAVRAPDAGNPAIEALQEQIARLSSRFERTDSELSVLPGIERAMHALFAHLEDTKANIEASATTAARTAMKAVLTGDPAIDPAAAAREIAALKAIQEDADTRTHATLNAVHETLEKVVDRLSHMEGDIARVRAPLAQAPRPMTPETRAAAPPVPDMRRVAAKAPSVSPLPDLVLDASDLLDEPVAKPKARAPVIGPRPILSTRDEGPGRADFIAAARRAAKAAQSDPSVLAMQQAVPGAAPADSRAGLMAKTRDYVATHKKPVLLGIAALFVLVGTLAVVETIKTGDGAGGIAANPAESPAPVHTAEAAPVAVQPAPSRATLADLTPSALPAAPPPAALSAAANDRPAASDPMPTGSITKLPSFAAQPPMASVAAGPPVALVQAADSGNAAAQFELAARYAEGRQVDKNFSLAATWYEKAARQGLAPAQYKLGSLYEKGLGVTRDSAKARAWYTKAAEAGNPRAMHNLAVLIADGDGKPDYAGAVQWFRKAAEYGVHDSQYNLGILLARGLGAPQSLVQSYQWFAVAAAQNDADAALKRDEVGAKMGPNDVAVAKALAAAFHPKAPDTIAIEVDSPAGGWDGASSPSPVKNTRAKISSL